MQLSDPDIDLRCRVIRILGKMLAMDQDGNPAPGAVRRVLAARLSRMRTRDIYALLQAAYP
jgi:hypothetical protein